MFTLLSDSRPDRTPVECGGAREIYARRGRSIGRPRVTTPDRADADSTGVAELTLLFSLGAARSLANPAAAFADARRWSAHVGVIANDTRAVEAFLDRYGVENDYAIRRWDKWGTMEAIRESTDTPRHVFVGTGRTDRQIADATDWEYRPVREAAELAGWERRGPADRTPRSGRLSRLRGLVRDRPWWPF